MIAPLIVHGLALGAAASLAAVGTERVARAWRRPSRWVWLTAMLATALVPVVAHLLPDLAGATLGAEANPLGSYAVVTWKVTTGATRGAAVDVLLGSLWAGASLLLVARLALGAWLLRREARSWPREQIDGVAVLVSSGTGPAVAGVWPARIILPRWVTELDPKSRALVVQHEREHCDARDTLPIYAATLLCALFPWNPALWWQSRRLRLAVEVDCDARVLRADHPVEDYGRLLLTIAVRRGARAVSPAPALTEPISFLERRIDAMMRIPARHPATIVAAVATTVLAIAVACSGPAPTDAPRAAASARAGTATHPVGGAPVEFKVKHEATPLPGSPGPRYPDALRTAGVEGEVKAQFVVDTGGRVVASTFKVLETSDERFTDAVRLALPNMRFRPADIDGRKVKQLVEMPFQFTLSK